MWVFAVSALVFSSVCAIFYDGLLFDLLFEIGSHECLDAMTGWKCYWFPSVAVSSLFAVLHANMIICTLMSIDIHDVMISICMVAILVILLVLDLSFIKLQLLK